jgi:hypothetical protein
MSNFSSGVIVEAGLEQMKEAVPPSRKLWRRNDELEIEMKLRRR